MSKFRSDTKPCPDNQSHWSAGITFSGLIQREHVQRGQVSVSVQKQQRASDKSEYQEVQEEEEVQQQFQR
jgi:hypothetical protein